MNILIIEDDPGIRESLCQILTSNGYSPTPTPHGLEASLLLDQYEHTQHPLPSLILLDWNMPVMSGFEFLELKACRPWKSIPTLILSSQALFECEEEVIKKPFRIDDLLQAIEQKLQSLGCDQKS